VTLLLDTHVLLWLLAGDHRLGSGSRGAIEGAARVHVSAASLWEIAIKAGLGRLTVPDDLPDVVEASGLETLPVTAAHAWGVRRLVGLEHRDPFDRMLLTQAGLEGLSFLTVDGAILAAADRIEPRVGVLDARH
jgi:PIN domain nuclease of toxin-antitoxin system|tara:strand:- start:54 stop:455 length:402 start_codon:yes stop_codon:yes gene_type:complete